MVRRRSRVKCVRFMAQLRHDLPDGIGFSDSISATEVQNDLIADGCAYQECNVCSMKIVWDRVNSKHVYSTRTIYR